MDVIADRSPRRLARHLPLLGLVAMLALGGCAVVPEPYAADELRALARADRESARKGMPEIEVALTLEEAIARALKYNLDHRVRLLEQALAAGQLDASRFDMLPRLIAGTSRAWRDEENVRSAVDSVTGLPSLSNPFVSSEKAHTSVDAGLSWNLLDFGASYYSARQNADRLLIAGERRRRAMHVLVQNVRTAFWRALASEKLAAQVRATIVQAEAALGDSRRVSDERVRAPAEALRYQRNLLENLRLLENVDRELSSARIELASLIGVDPGSRFALVEPPAEAPSPLREAAEAMEELALANNADLREQFYSARIAATETRKALLRLLPGISFEAAHRRDDDRYLINQQWNDAGVRVSFNLLNLLAAPSQMRAAEMGLRAAQGRRMALQMAVVTQVHLARHQYDDALRQYQRAEAIFEVDNQLAELAVSQERSQMASRLDRIAANVSFILSAVRRYHAVARVHEAASRVQATIGREPQLSSLDDVDLPTLAREVAPFLKL